MQASVVVSEPFGPDVAEIPLPNSPLVKVLAQVRFPPIASIDQQSFIADFQEALRPRYPVLRENREGGMLITPEGIKPSEGARVWKLMDRDANWQVSLAPNFLALDVTQYSSRSEFVERLREALDAASKAFGPASVDRVGVRYIDRITGESLLRLPQLIRREVLGVVAAVGGDETVHPTHAVSDALYVLPDQSALRARWGQLPADATLDPFVDPVGETSWILDLDLYSEQSRDFLAKELSETVNTFAGRIYRYFRWAVTPELLSEFGASL